MGFPLCPDLFLLACFCASFCHGFITCKQVTYAPGHARVRCHALWNIWTTSLHTFLQQCSYSPLTCNCDISIVRNSAVVQCCLHLHQIPQSRLNVIWHVEHCCSLRWTESHEIADQACANIHRPASWCHSCQQHLRCCMQVPVHH